MAITYAQLVTRIQSGAITAEELDSYFRIAASIEPSFEPVFAINEDEVDLSGIEISARASANDLAYEASLVTRNKKLKALGAPTPDGTIIAEGDSWFNLPDLFIVPKTMIDFLAEDYPINNIAHWGDTLSDIVLAGEHIPYLLTGTVRRFLFSAGGNDVLGGGRLADFIKQRMPGDNDPDNAPLYVLPAYYDMSDKLIYVYAQFLTNVRRLSPNTIIIVHGYDYCLPRRGGPWLGQPLQHRGCDPVYQRDLARAIIRVLVDDFNVKLRRLARRMGNTEYVDLRGTTHEDEWWDELHPREAAAERMADIVAAKMNIVVAAAPKTGRRRKAQAKKAA